MELKKKLLKQLRLEISFHCYVKVYMYNNGLFLKGRTWTGQGARSGVKIWPFWNCHHQHGWMQENQFRRKENKNKKKKKKKKRRKFGMVEMVHKLIPKHWIAIGFIKKLFNTGVTPNKDELNEVVNKWNLYVKRSLWLSGIIWFFSWEKLVF